MGVTVEWVESSELLSTTFRGGEDDRKDAFRFVDEVLKLDSSVTWIKVHEP